jgi:hypothetical protein
MGAMDRDITWIQTQLTMARWYLDAAVSAGAESVRQHVERARQTYEGIRRALTHLDMNIEDRKQIEKALLALGERIAAAESD